MVVVLPLPFPPRNPQNLAFRDLEIEPVHDLSCPEAFAKAVHVDCQCGHDPAAFSSSG